MVRILHNGKVWTEEKSDTWVVYCWRIENFMKFNLNEYGFESDTISFRSGSWKLVVDSNSDSSNTSASTTGSSTTSSSNACSSTTASSPSRTKGDVIKVVLRGKFPTVPYLIYIRGSRIFYKLSVGDSDSKSGIIHSGECMWRQSRRDKVFSCFHRLLLGYISDAKHLLHSDGSLVVRFELRFVRAGTSDAYSTVVHLRGEYGTVGTLDDVSDSTRKTWNVPDFQALAEKKRHLCSKSFLFGTRLLRLHVSSPSSPYQTEVILFLKTVSRNDKFSPFSWILSIKSDSGTVLRSYDGVCECGKGQASISLGFMRDLQSILSSDGNLRVVCELHPLKKTRHTSHAELKAGSDVLMRDFKKLLSSEESSDVTIRVKGERDFRVHRTVLIARTPVFGAMFRHEMSESATGIVNIADCEPDTFERFLQHVYTGKVEDLRSENAISLYQVADKYQVDELKFECLQCMKEGLSMASFCPTIKLALHHCETELTQLATKFFVNNAKAIIVTVEWQNFIGENPIVANELFAKTLGASGS